MDDLTSKINEIMSDPEKLKEIQNLGKMMGLVGNSQDNSQSGGNSGNQNNSQSLGGLAGLGNTGNMNNSHNSNSGNSNGNTSKGNSPLDLGGIDPSIIGKIAPILSSFNKEDETTRLFDALAPFLSAERQEKLQKIRRMMVIIKLLPNIKNLGLF